MLQMFLYLVVSEILVDSLHIITFLISGHLLNLLSFVPGDSPALDIVDIDKDNGNPQMCASYVVEIYSNLMASEVFYCILVKKEMLLRSASIFLYFRCRIEHGITPVLDICVMFCHLVLI